MRTLVYQIAWIISRLFSVIIALWTHGTTADTLLPPAFTCGPGTSEVMIDSETSGVFHSPGWPASLTPGSRCLFRFVAPPGRKVLIEFANFHTEGLYPYCHKDFLDVYIDVAASHPRNKEEMRFLAYLQESQGQQTTTPFVALLFSSMLARSRLLGRFCGIQRDGGVRNIPQCFVSIHREVILDFFTAPSTSRIDRGEKLGFNGTFKIIPDDLYYPGKVASAQDIPSLPRAFLTSRKHENAKKAVTNEPICRFVIQPKSESGSERGEFVSPAYPGFHPPGLHCIYAFRGQPNQRISVEILDLSLSSQLHACSTDYIQFFDGNNVLHSPSIGNRICGEQKGLQVFSSESSLTMIFVTKSTINEVTFSKYRGFRISYQFWDKFVQIEAAFKEKHILGTECDFAIRSGGKEEGKKPTGDVTELLNFYYSMTLPPSHTCTFFFLGRHERQKVETIRAAFGILDLPPNNLDDNKCSYGHMAVYGARIENDEEFNLRPVYSSIKVGLDADYEGGIGTLATPTGSVALPRPSQVWCGDHLDAIKTKDDVDSSAIVSLGSTLALRFNASGKAAMNVRFQVFYKFVSDYGIVGLMPIPNMCWFVYKGSDYRDGQVGWTNSPFFANTYPPNSTCLYLFQFDPDQSVRLSFTTFQTAAVLDPTSAAADHFHHCPQKCKQDYLEVIELLTQVTDTRHVLQHFASVNIPIRRQISFSDMAVSRGEEHRQSHLFCGDCIPGPLIPSTDAKALLLAFRTDEVETAVGFQLKFQFLPITQLYSMGKDLCASATANTSEFGGVLHSPGYPSAYPSGMNCDWEVSVHQPALGIMIHFTELSVEGSFKECKNAVIRIKVGESVQSAASICGFASAISAFVANHTSVTISMLTTENADGAKGFQLVWTKLLPLQESSKCEGFRCKQSRHCIAKEMECNGYTNCGTYTEDGHTITDDSDETTNCQGPITHSYLHIGLGILLTIVMLACLSIYVIHREYRKERKKAHDPLDNVPGDEDEEVAPYSPRHTASVEEKQSPFPKQFVDTGYHHCQHLITSQAYPPSLQNGAVGESAPHHHNTVHHGVAHYCTYDRPIVCSHSSNHSVKSSHSPNSPAMSLKSRGNSHCSICPCGHTLLISSPPPLPLPLLQSPLHSYNHTSSRSGSCGSETKERMQKVSIV
ncbi:Low-density lipoprotein receptor-related protein 3 [Echinococcus granulosus]|uniref:Cubilin n=2 Tax=Echinococcus granulosus TaxID=6210 RepID=A0A068WFA6_ECHGR|nr:Low-density lipoprotein receptor-related protein 3 [Echinococcus granulosus]CDS18746.1 cubilin [Echinococcus granulosus]